MMDMVSVIIPVYNVEKYVERCIVSVIEQTYKNLEILVIDDGSKDSSSDVCDAVAKKDKRVRVIHQKNQGVSVARNTGIREASGAWLCFVDGDDYIESNMIQALVDKADESTDLVISDFYVDTINNKKYSQFIPGKNSPFFTKSELFEYAMIRSDTQKITCIGTPWAKLYSAKLIKDNNLLYPVGVKRNQDVVFNLYVFNEAKRVCYLPEALYNYIVWSNSAVNKYWADFSSIYLSVVNSMKVFEESINNSEERNFFENLLNQRKKYMFHETLKLQFFHPKRGIIYSENYKAFVKFLIKSDYLILLQSGNDSLTMAQKIMLLLVKLKMFRIVYLYYDVMFLYAYKKALFSR